MKKNELVDDENPQWSDEMFEKATNVENSTLPSDIKQALLNNSDNKTSVKISLSNVVLDFYKKMGDSWQDKINNDLLVNVR
ncbi:MAG: hypothetical protein DRQ51_03705 [Gammaproteobacteria bacterium]|nr:MAG: hypothetical protein DRQ51_03705 [Gammaproteobacteria bacterium]